MSVRISGLSLFYSFYCYYFQFAITECLNQPWYVSVETLCLTQHTQFFRNNLFSLWRCGPKRTIASSFLSSLDNKKRRNAAGRTPADEWSAHRRDLYLTTHNIHKWQTSLPLAGSELTIPSSERPQTHALDRTATRTGFAKYYVVYSLK
jgi:hypothetical protein